jgi:hypothetical protein
MTTATSIASVRTDEQAQQYRWMVEGFARTAVDCALEQVVSNREGWQNVLDRGGEMRGVIIKAVVDSTRLLAMMNEQLDAWVKFYREVFGVELDLSKLTMPAHREGFDRLLVVAEGFSCDRVYNACKQHFACWKYTDWTLDEAVSTNDRNPASGSYAVRIRERVEADEELASKSANDLASMQIPSITLLERLILELKYWKETGNHLDIQKVTLCAGSRNSDGDVPGVDWHDDGLHVHLHRVGTRCANFRSRQVVAA